MKYKIYYFKCINVYLHINFNGSFISISMCDIYSNRGNVYHTYFHVIQFIYFFIRSAHQYFNDFILRIYT